MAGTVACTDKLTFSGNLLTYLNILIKYSYIHIQFTTVLRS